MPELTSVGGGPIVAVASIAPFSRFETRPQKRIQILQLEIQGAGVPGENAAIAAGHIVRLPPITESPSPPPPFLFWSIQSSAPTSNNRRQRQLSQRMRNCAFEN
jgi:hypothetical protein